MGLPLLHHTDRLTCTRKMEDLPHTWSSPVNQSEARLVGPDYTVYTPCLTSVKSI